MEEGLDPRTIVNMADGQYVSLEEIKRGDEVMSYDFKKKDFVVSKVMKVTEIKNKKPYRIDAKDALHCSAGFKLLLDGGKKKTARTLKPGDKIMTEHGHEEEIIDVTKIEDEAIRMINLKVKAGNFIAEGFVVESLG